MKTNHKLRWALLVAGMSTLTLAPGCSDENDNPSPGSNVIGGTKGNAGSGSKAGSGNEAGSSNNVGGEGPGAAGNGTGNEGGTGPVVGAGGEAGGENPIPECNLPETGEDGCFNCPKTDLQYLNRCSDGDCVPFDNSRLTKLNPDGSLPDLN
jgi:hypothetical protein